MPKVGFFLAEELHQLPDLAALRAALAPGAWTDAALTHAPGRVAATMPQGLVFGRNVFGPGHSPGMIETATAMHMMRRVASVVVNNARYSVNSLTLLDSNMRVFSDGIENIEPPTGLVQIDPMFLVGDDGSLHAADALAQATDFQDCIAMPVCSHGFHNFGHFLFDGLPAILQHRMLFPELDLRIVGKPLDPWQAEILQALGLLDRYLPLTRPTLFRKMLTSSLLSMHVPYPTRFIRPIYDTLRLVAGRPTRTDRRIFLSRADDPNGRTLVNRAAVEGGMRDCGFEVVRPETMSFDEQVSMMAEAAFVVAETGAALANVGFCDPGTRILEIQPDRFHDGWARATCFLLALRWHVYFARVEPPPAGQPEIKHIFDYAIDPGHLVRAVAAVDAQP